MLKHWRANPSAAMSSRNSTVFSVEDDLTELDRQVRQNLELHFRPVFQRFVYGGERIASHDLRRLMHDEFYRDLLPPDKVYELVDLVDFNPGKAISYNEFCRIVTGGYDTDETEGLGMSKSQLLTDSPKTWLNTICRNSAIQSEVDDHLRTYRWCPPPFFMVTISLVQLVVFIYYAVDISNLGVGVNVGALDVIPAYSPIMYLPTKRQEPWRFITYMFLHQGVLDMLFNVCLQVIIGFPLEIMFSWWRVGTVYIIGVIIGSLAQSVCDRYVGLGGAAGGCYAIIFGHVMALIVNWSELNNKASQKSPKKWWGRPLLRLVIILVVVAIQLSLAIFRRFYPGYPGYKVGIAAHLGGLATGLFLGHSVFSDSVTYPWNSHSFFFNVFTVLLIFAGAAIFNIVYHDYPEAV